MVWAATVSPVPLEVERDKLRMTDDDIQPLREVPALIVRQWLDAWNNVQWNPNRFQSKPKEHFYIFTLPASQLRSLSGIYRRSTRGEVPRAKDLKPQRYLDQARSEEIARYKEFGFP